MKFPRFFLLISLVMALSGCSEKAPGLDLPENHLAGKPLKEFTYALRSVNEFSSKTFLARSLKSTADKKEDTESAVALDTWPMLLMHLDSVPNELKDCTNIVPGFLPVPRISAEGEIYFEMVQAATASKTRYAVSAKVP